MNMFCSLLDTVPQKDVEQYRQGAHFQLPPHLTDFLEQLLEILELNPNELLLDSLFPYIFMDNSTLKVETIKLSADILNILEHLHN